MTVPPTAVPPFTSRFAHVLRCYPFIVVILATVALYEAVTLVLVVGA